MNKFVKFYLLIIFSMFQFAILNAQSLKVSQNGRYLVKADGTPFFYLGDTAWELFHRLDAKEAESYLSDRAAKGFTVIQAVVLAQLGGLTLPNANGVLPLRNKDPNSPIDAYFQHVDEIVEKAEELGLIVGMLPTWGSYWNSTNGQEKIFAPESAYAFGKFLGERYIDKPIIWILGGDENINNEEERTIIDAMAQGIKAGDKGTHLITFHPRGPGRSSDYFHQVDWLDFNMSQSSHGARDHDNGIFTASDYQLRPVKPTLDGEPRYEMIPVGFYFSGANQMDVFDDYDCRQAAYWSLLSGACGHTYGHNSIWQMWAPGRKPVLGAVVPWFDALDHPGALQMGYLRRLFEARPFYKLIPDQSLIMDGPTSGGGKVRAAIADDFSFAIVYSARGLPFTIDQSRLKAKRLKAIWFDPRYGVAYPLHTANTLAIQTYTPPSQGRGKDWVLILEDADLELPMPGR